MSTIQFDRYYKYDEMTEILQGWAETYPTLCKVDVLGKSHEGRDIWILTITNMETGPDTEKPAYWVDGNIHATELSASTAALHLAYKLLTEYGSDEKITYVLDSRAFYIVPRLNPDGAEWALADVPRFIRSSTKSWPREDRLDGLHGSDVDGDGRILQMRIRDPQGAWKPHDKHPKLMVRREPTDLPGGKYYRLLPEGDVQNYDGVMLKGGRSQQGLDLNRNFPSFWKPEQGGAGEFAGSEPEPGSAIKWVVSHRNITGSVSFHTYSGVNLRPPTKGPDSDLPTTDLRTYKRIGEHGKKLTGYPAIAVYHDFAYDPKNPMVGTFDDWMYEFNGCYAWTTEIWSAQTQAGIKDYKFFQWFIDHPTSDDVQIYEWFQEKVSAETYIDWYEFDHPQLGKVELGGWERLHSWRNPPLEMLEKEIAPLSDFCIDNLLISPKLEQHSLDVESNGDVHKIRFVVHNTGWLPTNVSQMALKRTVVKPLEVQIELPEGAKLLAGEKLTFAGQLPGRDHLWSHTAWVAQTTDERAKFEWVVQAPVGSEIQMVAKHERAGVVRASVTV